METGIPVEESKTASPTPTESPNHSPITANGTARNRAAPPTVGSVNPGARAAGRILDGLGGQPVERSIFAVSPPTTVPIHLPHLQTWGRAKTQTKMVCQRKIVERSDKGRSCSIQRAGGSQTHGRDSKPPRPNGRVGPDEDVSSVRAVPPRPNVGVILGSNIGSEGSLPPPRTTSTTTQNTLGGWGRVLRMQSNRIDIRKQQLTQNLEGHLQPRGVNPQPTRDEDSDNGGRRPCSHTKGTHNGIRTDAVDIGLPLVPPTQGSPNGGQSGTLVDDVGRELFGFVLRPHHTDNVSVTGKHRPSQSSTGNSDATVRNRPASDSTGVHQCHVPTNVKQPSLVASGTHGSTFEATRGVGTISVVATTTHQQQKRLGTTHTQTEQKNDGCTQGSRKAMSSRGTPTNDGATVDINGDRHVHNRGGVKNDRPPHQHCDRITILSHRHTANSMAHSTRDCGSGWGRSRRTVGDSSTSKAKPTPTTGDRDRQQRMPKEPDTTRDKGSDGGANHRSNSSGSNQEHETSRGQVLKRVHGSPIQLRRTGESQSSLSPRGVGAQPKTNTPCNTATPTPNTPLSRLGSVRVRKHQTDSQLHIPISRRSNEVVKFVDPRLGLFDQDNNSEPDSDSDVVHSPSQYTTSEGTYQDNRNENESSDHTHGSILPAQTRLVVTSGAKSTQGAATSVPPEQLDNTRWHTFEQKSGAHTVSSCFIRFTTEAFERRGIAKPRETAVAVFSDYKGGLEGGKRQLNGPWIHFASIANTHSKSKDVAWSDILTVAMLDKMVDGSNNQAITISNASNIILDVALNLTTKSHKARKLKHLAQSARARQPKRSKKNDVSIDLQPVHQYIFSKLVQVKHDITKLKEDTLRAACCFFIQLVGCGRAQDPHALLNGIEIFPPGVTRWKDVKRGDSVITRLYRTKDVELHNCNNEAVRAHIDRAYDELSSVIVITRQPYFDNTPDYFNLMDEYKQRLLKTDPNIRTPVYTVSVDYRDGKGSRVMELKRMFLGLTNTQFSGLEMKEITLQARVNDLLVKSGAVSHDRLHKCKHIRHSIVTFVLAYGNITNTVGEPSGPVAQMLLRSRHAMATAEKTYDLVLHKNSLARLHLLPKNIHYDFLVFLV